MGIDHRFKPASEALDKACEFLEAAKSFAEEARFVEACGCLAGCAVLGDLPIDGVSVVDVVRSAGEELALAREGEICVNGKEEPLYFDSAHHALVHVAIAAGLATANFSFPVKERSQQLEQAARSAVSWCADLLTLNTSRLRACLRKERAVALQVGNGRATKILGGGAAAEDLTANEAVGGTTATEDQTLDMRAVTLFFQDTSRTKKQIAQILGKKHTQSLSPARCPKLHAAMKAHRGSAFSKVRGSKSRDGSVEAWVDEPSEDDG
jgi:hypothetical protein